MYSVTTNERIENMKQKPKKLNQEFTERLKKYKRAEITEELVSDKALKRLLDVLV